MEHLINLINEMPVWVKWFFCIGFMLITILQAIRIFLSIWIEYLDYERLKSEMRSEIIDELMKGYAKK